MRVLRWSTLAAAVLATCVYASPVYADSISGSTCGNNSCFGGVWTLEYSANLATASTTDYNIFFSVDATNLSFGDITDIAFKVTAQNPVSASIVTSPAGWGNDVVFGTIDASGCPDTNMPGGFVCSTAVTPLDAPAPTTYTWQFLVDIGNQTLLTGALAASIKANGTNTGQLLSENITLQPVPEPTTLLLVGTMLAGVGVWGRKRWLEGKAA